MNNVASSFATGLLEAMEGGPSLWLCGGARGGVGVATTSLWGLMSRLPQNHFCALDNQPTMHVDQSELGRTCTGIDVVSFGIT